MEGNASNISVDVTVQESIEKSLLERASDFFADYLVLALIALGLLTNAISACILTRRFKMFKSSCVYFLILSYSDFFCTVFMGVFWWVGQNHNKYKGLVDIYILNVYVCKAMNYLENLAVSVSSFTMVTLSMERALSVLQPTKARVLITKSRRIKFLVCGYVFFTVLWIQTFFNFELRLLTFSRTLSCLPSLRNPVWFQLLYSYEAMLVNYTVPSLLVIISNFVAAVGYLKSARIRKAISTNSRTNAQARTNVSATMALLSLQYMITFLPFSVAYPTYSTLLSLGYQRSDPLVLEVFLWLRITYVIAIANFSLNFFFYVFKIQAFRKAIFCGKFEAVADSESS